MSMARGNAPASQKFRRSQPTVSVQKRRLGWAETWAAINRELGRRLREGRPA